MVTPMRVIGEADSGDFELFFSAPLKSTDKEVD